MAPFIYQKVGTTPIALHGNIALWQRPVCAPETQCPVPKPLGVVWDISASLPHPQSPTRPGTVTQDFSNGPWQLKVSFYWVAPGGGAQDSVVTQTRLTHGEFGLITECTRYDRPSEVQPFPAGACSGVHGQDQFGLSLIRQAQPSPGSAPAVRR